MMDTMMMKLSVLFLLALQTPSSANPLDNKNNTEFRNVSLINPHLDGRPEVTANGSMPTELTQNKPLQFYSDTTGVGETLEWVTWDHHLPKYAVSIYNGHVHRFEYVCKYKCNAGFYSSSMGPYCHYPNGKKTYSGSPFEILVNKDNFEILEWKGDSHGSVPQNSVRTCPGEDTYVGMNKYGLGKVQGRYFYLPWTRSSDYRYKDYQVLTIYQNVINQHIYDVRYNTDKSNIFRYPPETFHETAISNYECREVKKTDTFSQTYQVAHSWDIAFSLTVGLATSITVGVPLIFSDDIHISSETTFQYSRENTMMKDVTNSVTVDVTAPPNHACTVRMVQYKYKADIPFTALLRRTYGNGEIRTMSITGRYKSVQIREIRAVLDRCEPLEGARRCP